MFLLYFCNSPPFPIFMHYCPDLVKTIVSPQHVCMPGHSLFDGHTTVDRHSTQPFVQFFLRDSIDSVTAPLIKNNNLYFSPNDCAIPPSATVRSILSAELWHQRLGHPGLTQLDTIANHSTSIPPNPVSSAHPFRHCKVCSDANPKRYPKGPTILTDDLLPGTRFHIDFGFLRASSAQYKPVKGTLRVITSIDGFNAYLLIACAKTRYTFCFLTVSKAPPAEILDAFLTKHGLKSGARFIRMDQGGDLWRSEKIRTVAAKHDYMLEPTGSDSPSQNGKVEHLNGTFGVMVCALLYSSGLVPIFWSSALVLSISKIGSTIAQFDAPPILLGLATYQTCPIFEFLNHL
jgi:hypothetical protein